MIRRLTRLSFVAVLVAACSPAPSATSQPSAPTGPVKAANQTLRIATNVFPNGATPYVSAYNIQYFGMVFDSLVRFDKEFNVLPSVAEKWELLPDNSAWRFTLRKDLTFSNGDKLTAEDVAFTVELGIKERLPVAQQSASLKGAKIVDPYTVDLLVAGKDVSTLYIAPSWFVFPKRYYEQAGKETFTVKPIGSGPYTLSDYRPTDLLVYTLRPEAHPFRKPVLTQISVKNVPDPSSMLAGLRTGEVDFILGALSADQAKAAKDAGLIVETQNTGYSSILFNKEPIKGTPLEDPRVRLAMNYAVDKEALAKTIYAGFAEPIGQLTAPNTPAFNASIKPIPYDVAKAKQLLAEAGYPNGFKVAGGVDYVARPVSTSQLLAVQSYHRAVGIDWELVPLESAVYVEVSYGAPGRVRKEMIDAGGNNNNGLFTFQWAVLRCDLPAPLYCAPGLDANMRLAVAELDATKRAQHLQAAMKAWVDEVPMVFLVAPPTFIMYRPNVKAFQWTTQTYYSFDSMYLAE